MTTPPSLTSTCSNGIRKQNVLKFNFRLKKKENKNICHMCYDMLDCEALLTWM